MVREARLKFTRELSGALTIGSVGPDGIRINEQLWAEAIALTPDGGIDPWDLTPVADLQENHFAALLAQSPELLLIGSGARNQFLPRELNFAFARMGVGLEVMDTAAAARTYNVLAMEGRRVAAVLYPV
jgi:uncharacterized protein